MWLFSCILSVTGCFAMIYLCGLPGYTCGFKPPTLDGDHINSRHCISLDHPTPLQTLCPRSYFIIFIANNLTWILVKTQNKYTTNKPKYHVCLLQWAHDLEFGKSGNYLVVLYVKACRYEDRYVVWGWGNQNACHVNVWPGG